MLNEKRAGMPVPKQRPMPRIVAGTDLMAALRQSIEKAKEETPKTAAKQAAPAPAASRSEACCGGQRQADGERQPGPARDAVADRRRRAREGSRRGRKGSAGETDRAKAWRAEEGGIAARFSAP